MLKAPTLLTTADVGHLLGLTPNRVRQLADAGKLRCSRTKSGTRLYQMSDVNRLVLKRAKQKKER